MSDMVAEKSELKQPIDINRTGSQNGQRKLSTVSLKEFLKGSSKNEANENSSENESSSSLTSDTPPERRSLPDRVSFATTWVTARLLRRHRERRARRMREEAMGKESADKSADKSANKSALSILTDDDITTCRAGLQPIINSENCLAAFKEFLDKEHSNENLDFWLEAEKYRKAEDENRESIAKFILENFIQVRYKLYSMIYR